MNRRRKLLIPLLFCGAMLTACDDKSAENAAAMTPEVGVVTLSPGSVNVLSELPGRTAVSYTHLDVYKRQALCLKRLCHFRASNIRF